MAKVATEKKGACDCAKCRRLCERNPGWMTPAEAERAIRAGFGSRLMLDWWCDADEPGGELYVLSPAAPGHENGRAPEDGSLVEMMFGGWTRGGCTFYQNGGCELHATNFKPEECRRAFACDPQEDGEDIHESVANKWRTQKARALVKTWQRQSTA